MLKTLRRRLILSHTLTLFIIAPLMALALIYILESQVLLPDISRELDEQARLMVRLANDHPEIWDHPDRAQALVDGVGADVSALVMLLDRDGLVLASNDTSGAVHLGDLFHHPGLRTILAGETSEHQDYSPITDSQVADVFIPVMTADHKVLGVIRMAHRLSTIYDQFLRLRYFVLGIMALALVVGTIGGTILAIRLENPLRDLAWGMNRLATAQELNPLAEQGPEEIRLVQHAFNVLMKRLRSLQESRRQLLANTVHELSTPLGALKSATQALQEGADEEAGLRQDLLRGMSEEIQRLTRLLQDLTHMYDQVLGNIALDRKAVALSEWLPKTISLWKRPAEEKGLQWIEDLSPTLPTVPIDADRMSQVLGNLLNNAIKYTDRGGTVIIRASSEKGGVQIRVTDTGHGISSDELGMIFTPFYRGRRSGRFPEGMGLGLPIAKELAEAHGGRLEVESALGRGSTFTLWLPT